MAGRDLPPTLRGEEPYLVISAVQKMVRRSRLDEALFARQAVIAAGNESPVWHCRT
jgi:replication-associated recombination protein RarA